MDHHIYSYEEVKLKIIIRKLLTDYMIWTRQFIVDLLANLPSLDKTIERLLKNQEAIGNCIKPYFGDMAGNSLTSLLKEHINITVDLLKTVKAGDTTKATILEGEAIINAENISTFFATINPCYSKDELMEMFSTHLVLVKYQFISRMNTDYNADIIYYDMGLHHILMMSDYIFKGIIERFYEEQIMDQYHMYQTEEYIPNQYQEQYQEKID